MKKLIALFILFLPLLTFAASLEVNNLRSQDGFVAVSIFPETAKNDFPERGTAAVQTYYVPILDKGSVLVHLKDLPVGRYGITVTHDEDGDGLLKKGPMRIPREGFGYSNNPRVYFAPPEFTKVLMPIREDSAIKIQMRYLL